MNDSGVDTAPELEAGAPHGAPRSRWKRIAISSAAFAIGLLLGLGTSFGVDRLTGRGEVLRGVTFQGVVLAGLDGSAVRDAVLPVIEELEKRRVGFAVQERIFEADAKSLGVSIDAGRIQSRALAEGRTGSLLAQFSWWLSRLFGRAAIPIEPQVDHAVLDRLLGQWLEATTREKAFSGAVVFENGAVAARYPVAGLEADARAVGAALPEKLRSGDAAPLIVPLERTVPLVGRTEIDAALAEARGRLGSDVSLGALGLEEPLVVTREEMGRALRSTVVPGPPRVVLSLDASALESVFDRVRDAVERPSRDASFDIDAQHRVTVVPSEVGVRIEPQKTADAIWDAARRSERRGMLVLVPAEPPSLSTEQAEGLRIKGLVSKFTTFHSCCEARVKNIHHAADLVDGTVLRPGEIFSLNEHLGPRTAAKGFVLAPSIVRGEMEETEGGGISQFATTLFNAVLDGGYEIVQRQPHSYYFERYPEGHEATVSYPLPDLSFKNDTGAGLLIRTQYGPTFIRILLYGDNEGRRVQRKSSRRFDITDPPIEYEANEAVAPDAAKLLYAGRVGWSIEVSRVIHYADGETAEQRRKVTYKPRPRRVAVHPCKIPEGEKGYTGDECPEPPDAGADGGLS